MKIFIGALLAIIFSTFSNSIFAQSQYGCQNTSLTGTYLLIQDSDGTTPAEGAIITLILQGNSAKIHAVMQGTDIWSDGEFSACEDLITMSVTEFDFNADNQSFSVIGNMLTLPFVVMSDVEVGHSEWQKISNSGDDQASIENGDGNNEGGSGNGGDGNNGSNNGNNGNNGNGNSNGSGNGNNNGNNNGNGSNNGNNPYNPNDNNDISPYIGDYIGTGWGWEVRFKHTSGEFVSQFTGADPDELPFEGDKVIMSLMVEHATKFKIHIDEDGRVTGEGEIIYNLIPNLCGVAILTEQVNSAINMMGEVAFFYDLSANISKRTVKDFEGTFLGAQGELAKNMKAAYETGANSMMEYAGYVLPNKIKNLDESSQKDAAICNCAAGIPNVAGGTQIGPSNLQDLITSVGIDAAKTILMDFGKPGGFMLSIPGLTQIQYYYKGLQNGPESRTFKIMGYLVNGELYLEMDGDVTGGSKDLTIEYMVNYEKETPTFPTWSPFQKDPATMHAAGSEATIYEQETKMIKKEYVDYVTGEKKTVEVPVQETEEKKVTLPFPFATFREAGMHRNGVSVWQEYEYNWEVYKANQSK
ncbi:MAG: hypothetical protein JXR53_03680 [Bacteroidales bacterium]|nr:hypothetical protein [Bacteroidales bacterium]